MADSSSSPTFQTSEVPDHTLAAGEVLELPCPEQSVPLVKEGQYFPQNAPTPQGQVLSVKDHSVVLGFFQGGNLRIDLPCSNDKKISSSVLLKVLESKDQPEAVPPLPVENMRYPLWFWILLVVLALLPFLVWAGIKSRRKKKILKNIQKKIPLTPTQKMEAYLKEASALLKKQKTLSLHENKHFYSQGYTCFRAFLDQRFKLNSAHETTREFLGTLRSTASLWNLSTQDVTAIDLLLSKADQVRFASDAPEAQERELFLKTVYDFFKKYQITGLAIDPSESSKVKAK